MDLPVWVLALLALAAFVAGVVDAIAGGGGLITVPALLAAGLPPTLALGTNKGQSVWGSGAALASYAKAGLVRGDRAKVTFPIALFGALGGSWLVLQVPAEFLRPVILGLLVAVALFLATRRRLEPRLYAGETPPVALWLSSAFAFVIAAYDGFFGPGTGTFLILCFVFFLHETPLRASAEAKVVNFASNLASCTLFALSGMIVWRVAIPMAVAQFLGATLGARITVKHGDGLVRWILFVVVLGTCGKLAYDLLQTP